MKTKFDVFSAILFLIILFLSNNTAQQMKKFKPLINHEEAEKRAELILSKLSIDEKIELVGGHNMFFIKGFEEYGIPEFYLSDATQGIHIRKDLDDQLEKSTSFPAPICLASTWNKELAYKYAKSIGEECRAGGIAVLLGPGMNIYRISQNGRNFEYFGEDPFLAASIIENYVIGLQNTGTIATLKHFVCNNSEFYRRRSNSIVDERTLHEIYLPAFKAGIDAGALAVMTSYNQVNGEWAGQSDYVINKLLRNDLGFKWLVMSDWWSLYDPQKAIKSGLDLDMPGHILERFEALKEFGDVYIRSNARQLLNEGKISEDDINRMAKNIIKTFIAIGHYDKPVKDESYLNKFPEHEKTALQTAREGIVLLRNENNILPINKNENKKILITGDYVEKNAKGGGAAEVEGFNIVTMLDALKNEFKENLIYVKSPSDKEIKEADVILLSIGTDDNEGWDKPFALPEEINKKIIHFSNLNSNTVVIVNSGSGIKMTEWNNKVAAIIYAWYPGQNGNVALSEILSGKTNPSGKLPITIEKQFEDSPGYPYLPEGEELYTGWENDTDLKYPINNIVYKEGVFVGYRWYESKNIEPLYNFGHGLSYTTFEYSNLNLSKKVFEKDDELNIEFNIKNIGKLTGAEIAQLYIHDEQSSVPRPVKELKGFSKIYLNPGEEKKVQIVLNKKDFSFWSEKNKDWFIEPGNFEILVGSASNNIKLSERIEYLDSKKE